MLLAVSMPAEECMPLMCADRSANIFFNSSNGVGLEVSRALVYFKICPYK